MNPGTVTAQRLPSLSLGGYVVVMEGFLALSNLFSQIASFPEDRTTVHQMLLDSLRNIIVKSGGGLIAVFGDGRWELSAAFGGSDRLAWGAAETLRSEAKNWALPLRTSPARLSGSFTTAGGERVCVLLESLPGEEFADQDKILFKAGLDLVATWETIHQNRKEALKSADKIKQLLDLMSGLREFDGQIELFFDELLQNALALVEEADFGSVALLDGDTWRFVSAVGHDLPGLARLRIPSLEFGSFTTVSIVEDLLHRMDVLSSKAMQQLQQVSRPVDWSMIISLDAGPNFTVNLSLDISAGSRRKFSEGSKIVLERFAKLASAFLRLRLQKEQIQRSYRSFTDKLAILAETHDKGTADHNARVARISGFLAEKMGLDGERVSRIRQGAMLHDIGKLFLDPGLLNKEGQLTEEEKERLKQHTLLAERLLDDSFFDLDRKIAVHHHERFDGEGYPHGLVGDEIPLEAQIVTVADVYDALRCSRSYKRAYGARDALSRMRDGDERLRPGGFNPAILAILETNLAEIEEIWLAIGEPRVWRGQDGGLATENLV